MSITSILIISVMIFLILEIFIAAKKALLQDKLFRRQYDVVYDLIEKTPADSGVNVTLVSNALVDLSKLASNTWHRAIVSDIKNRFYRKYFRTEPEEQE